jgi:23S rRNA (adenine2503-C2)-methyltransferase
LLRNLNVEEILEQVVHARRSRRVDRIVFMGMGEPTHNLEHVLAAVERLSREGRISPRRQTLSTVGSLAAFARLMMAAVKPCLALSLHSADEGVRRGLLPNAARDPLRELVLAADRYGRASGVPVQVQWTLLEGVNDRDADADALCALLHGVRCYVNFIVWNEVAGAPFAAPPRERIVALVRRVKRHGILATIRDSAGADVAAGCGQLRRRVTAAASR